MRSQHFSLGLITALAGLLAALHATALRYSLYWRFRWFDMPMHFMGGLLIASAALWIVAFVSPADSWFRSNRLIVALAAALAVGIAWEIFEYATGITKGEPGYWFDTIHDIALDIVGGTASYFIFKSYVR